VSRVPPIDPDEILRHIVEHPDLYAAEWDSESMDLKDQLLDMKLVRISSRTAPGITPQQIPSDPN